MEKYCLYIVLTRTNTVMSKLIQFVKNDEYTHAAISLDKELNNMYGFGRKNTYNPFVGRFRQEKVDEGLYKFHKNLPGVIMEVEVSKQQYKKAKDLLNHFIFNSNLYKYNYKGLIHSLFNKAECSETRFLCSEFVYHILKESNIADLDISRNLVRPQSLLDLKGKIIYKGNLKNIKSQHNNCNSIERESFCFPLRPQSNQYY
ncbi:hypothetical protein N4T77_13965 [Clostridium sp. CX1]|uniref:hypothetical protein n=1 Tax=Clostridium sp. CX1 TaxID=2978346 RepID=UPI0021C18DF3|nr:hypothetical protein [Clostridium sp. CX1]MCT8977702.1 hypothetical protein [Clostridium sp. CX1]